MREYKFRIFDTVENIYVNIKDFHLVFDLYGKLIAEPKEYIIGYKNRYTLEQYTGLKDKNGVEICEGDVIKLHKDYRLSGLKPIPIKGSISFDKEGYWKCSNTILEEIPLDSFVIIGNIHEEAKDE